MSDSSSLSTDRGVVSGSSTTEVLLCLVRLQTKMLCLLAPRPLHLQHTTYVS